ncbi:biorientation of chromosomes in cell division protein 1-like 1 [Punica granatum]|uniref:Biorientation of chromosomes in cell division protein 1-like 1 n=2 Tax=Punica granatum TaxID=22663 RepID=A0A6P8D142_PUNGR|nr:biorientation of chromosomes in cell division protein 1-like 1 [Punica granatum]XP_031387363.1 biorientation of chromosomes in cell division protein 1-like 1 [Punica granatum]PKI32534.1 hypothetical protein CRG98_047078 [Punica granatum]
MPSQSSINGAFGKSSASLFDRSAVNPIKALRFSFSTKTSTASGTTVPVKMARLISSADSGAGAATASHRVVFVDTSLDTHLAMAVSESDTVSDLKKKIIRAHQQCFPQFGEIKINAVKVNRRGHSYHLSDFIIVISAFDGVKKGWFLYFDASSPVERQCHPGEPPNAIVEIKERSNEHGTVAAIEHGSEAIPDLRVAFEAHGQETLLPVVKCLELRDEGSPMEINPSKKRRKMKSEATEPLNSSDAIVLPSGKDVLDQIHGETMEVDTGAAVTNLEKAIVLGNVHAAPFPEVLDSIEKADDALIQRADAEMNDLGAAKKENQSAADFVDEDCSLFHEMDVGLPSAGNAALANNQLSETGRRDTNKMLQANDAHVGAEEVSVVRAVDTENIQENTVCPKRRKKSSRRKSSAGEKLEISNSISHDNSFIELQQAVDYIQSENRLNDEKSLSEEGKEVAVADADKNTGKEHGLETGISREITENAEIAVEKMKKSRKRRILKETNVDQRSDRPEQEQSSQSKVERNKIAVVDANEKCGKEHEIDMGISGEIAETAESVIGKTKRRTKKQSSKDDQTSDRPGREQSSPSKDEGKETRSMAADQKFDEEHMDDVGSLQHIPDKAAVEDDLEAKIQKKKTRKRSSKEKKDDQSIDDIGKEQSYLPQAEGRDAPAVDADGKDITEKSADADNLEEKTKKKATRQRSKERNADRIDKVEASLSQAEGAKTIANMVAENIYYEQSGSEMEQSCQYTEKSADADNGKDKRKKKTMRRSSKEKNVDLSNDGVDKEANFSGAEGGEAVATVTAEGKPYEPNGNETERLGLVMENSAHVDIGKEKKRKKTTRSSREKNTDQSSDRIDKDQNYISQVEGAVVAASKTSEGEDGNERQSSLQIIEKPAKADNNDEKMQEKAKDWGNKNKDIDQSSDITEKEDRNHSRGAEGKKTAVVNADENLNLDHGDNNGEKAEKRTKSRQSSQKSIRSNREAKDLTSSHSAMEKDTSNLGSSVIMAKGKKSKATGSIAERNDQDLKAQRTAEVTVDPTTNSNSDIARVQSLEANKQGVPLNEVADNLLLDDHAGEANNPVDELHGREINFREYFVPRQSQQEVAASGNSSVVKVPKENRAGRDLKVKSGKRKSASSAMTGSLHLNEQTGEETSRFSKSDKLTSPVKKIRKTHGRESQASAFPKPKIMEFNANSERDSENSAASNSDMKGSKKPKRGRSSVDRFRVAIRKPSNKNKGEVVDSSERKRSLLSLSGAIFMEESSGSSERKGVENSDASTRTPSDNSLSDSSDSDTLNDDSRRDGEHSKGKSSIKGVESLSMDRILRSSSGYKKARLAAASQLEENESQPVEFVPDSQANV